jgi:hypothetical protein
MQRKHLEELRALLDAVKALTGSDYATAQALDMPRETISMWRAGTRTAMPADWVLLGTLAGLDPVEMLKIATIQQWEDKPKGQKLKDALGDC